MNIVHTEAAPAAIGPYSQAIVAAGMVFCSGQVAIDPGTGAVCTGDVTEQTRVALRNLAAVLDAAGSGLHRVVKTTVYVASMDDFPRMNAVYAEVFGDTRPARACVEVSRLPKDVAFEVDAIALL